MALVAMSINANGSFIPQEIALELATAMVCLSAMRAAYFGSACDGLLQQMNWSIAGWQCACTYELL